MNKTLIAIGALLLLAAVPVASAHVELIDLNGDGDCNDVGESLPGPHVHDCLTLTTVSGDGS
jgi:hypothetical protein